MSRYDPLRVFLAARTYDTVTLTLEQIDELVGMLPPSARHYSVWWRNGDSSHPHCQSWGRAGFAAYPDLARRRVTFQRTAIRAEMPAPDVRDQPQVHPGDRAQPHDQRAGLILVGCVRTKRACACAAAELFASPLFEGRRRYAVSSGLPWYILSAKFGLLAPEDVIGPYDVYLPRQSPAYRKAWGEFVTAQLDQRHPRLAGEVIEVHAGAAYAEPLRAPLAAKGVTMTTPLSHLGHGEQVAWYQACHHASGQARSDGGRPAGPVPARGHLGAHVAELVRALSDHAQALSPQDFAARGADGLQVPGLYSWWADERGAADLSRDLGLPVGPGLIYAGQAGATKWPSGKQSAGTLWGRICGMHLGAAAEFSTFRRTLAAILRSTLAMTSEDARSCRHGSTRTCA